MEYASVMVFVLTTFFLLLVMAGFIVLFWHREIFSGVFSHCGSHSLTKEGQ